MMKKAIKILKIVIGSIFLLSLLITFMFLYRINNSWKRNMSKYELIKISKHINDSPELNDRFYIIHDSIHPRVRHRGALLGLINKIKIAAKEYSYEASIDKKSYSIYPTKSPIEWVRLPLTQQRILKDTLRGYWFEMGINKYTTPEKCFDYYLNNAQFNVTDEYYRTIDTTGIHNLSILLFKTELKNLKDKDIIDLVRVIENQDEFILYNHLY